MKTETWPSIIPGLYLVPGLNRGRFPYSHSFFVDGDTTALLDAGCGPAALDEVRRRRPPDQVIVSHAHVDHCSGLWRLAAAPIVSPVQHADDFWRLPAVARRFMGPGEMADLWLATIGRLLDARDAAPSAHYADGRVFDFGGVRLQAIHAPGHMDDHYVFFEPTHGLALLFDIDLTSFGPWYGHEESDIDVFLASIEKVRALRPAIVASSHKGVVREEIDEHLRRFAHVIDRREHRLLELLSAPRTIDELVDAGLIYGRATSLDPLLRHGEQSMIEKHLRRLERNERIRREGERWSRIGAS